MKSVVLTGNSFEDLKNKINMLPKNARPLKLVKPSAGKVLFKKYKGFYLREWSCKPWIEGEVMTRYDTAYEV